MNWKKKNDESSRNYDTGREIDPRRQLDKSTTESGYGEMLYLDPNDPNLRRLQNMSPTTEGRQSMGGMYMSRSPGTVVHRQSVLQTVRQDLSVRNDTGKILDKKPIPTLSVSIPFRKEDFVEERSPKVINLAGGEKELEFNTRTLNLRRSPRDTTQRINYGTHNLNQENNIYLDAPMNMGTSFGREYQDDRRATMAPTSQGKIREIAYTGGMQGIESKMSPKRNTVLMNEKPIDNEQRMRQLKRVAELMSKEQENYMGTEEIQPDDGLYAKYKSDLDQIESMLRNSKGLDRNLEGGRMTDAPAIKRKWNQGYDQTKREGRLIPKDQQSITAYNNNVFGDRHRVLQKMNKLSSIMLAKSRSMDTVQNRSFDSTQGEKFNQSTLREDSKKRFAFSKSPQQKFIMLSLAMMSSKGPNCEDRIILRKMRYHKGGVVDLGQETKNKSKYQVKKIERKEKVGSGNNLRSSFAPKQREKASKVIQAWWRDVLNRYKSLLGSITHIQSVWRGNWLRKYLYDIIYLTYLHQNFCDKVKGVMVRHVRRDVWDSAFVNSDRENAHRRLLGILLIQKHARRFLDNLRNKRTRMALLLDKLSLRRKQDAFDSINKADGKTKKLKSANAMMNKLIPTLRSRTFKGLLLNTFNRPIGQLKSGIFKSMLKNNLTKFNLLPLRHYFMRWLKKSLRSGNNDEKKQLATKMLVKNIKKRRLGDVTEKLRQLPPKGLKEKILRSCVRKGEKYNDIVLKHYFRKWRDLMGPLRLKDMKDKVTGNFLFKTSKRLGQENLRRKFNRWRDAGVKGKDLEPFVNGTDKLKSFVRKNVHKQVMPIDGLSGVYSKMMYLLKNPKYRILSMRKAFNKWKLFVNKDRLEELNAKILLRFRGQLYDKNIKGILSRRFQDWRRKANIDKYIDKTKNDNTDKKKYFAMVKLMSGTEKLAKRGALKSATPQVIKYLDSLIRSKGVKNLLFMNPKFNRIILRNYFNKFKDQTHKMQMKQLKDKMFGSLTSNLTSAMTKKYLRRYLLKWNRKLPKNLEVKYFTGAEILQKAVHRRTIANPIEALKEKSEIENAKDGMMRSMGLKKKYIDRNWRQYLYKWKNNADKLKQKQTVEDFFVKFTNMMFSKNKDRILAKRFSHWKKVPKINMADIFDHFKKMIRFTELVVDKGLIPRKKDFLNRLTKTVHPKSYENALRTLANMALNGNNIKLQHYINRWKDQCKNIEIHNLKLKVLQAGISGNLLNQKKRDLNNAFHKWNKSSKIGKALKSGNRNLGIYQGGVILQDIKNRRGNDLMTRLHRLMNLDARGRLVLNIQKRLKRPQLSLAQSFAKWRRINDTHKNEVKSKNYITRMIKNSSKTIAGRRDRESLINAFNKWRSLSKRPSDYFLRISKGATDLDLWRKNKECNGPFSVLKSSRNYRAKLLAVLPGCNRLKARANSDTLRSRFYKWKDYVSACRRKDYAAMLMTNSKNGIFNKRINNIIGKKFYHWANIKKKSLHFPNFVKGFNKVVNVLQDPHKPVIINGLKKKADYLLHKDSMFKLFGASKTFKNGILKNAFMKWWKNSLLIDEDLPNRTMRTMKRYVVENHIMKPKEKYFRRWLARTIPKKIDLNDYNKGSDLLKRFINRKNYPKLKEMLQTPSSDYIKRQLLFKLVPNSKALAKRILSNGFNKWKRNVDRSKLKDARLLLLNKLYNKDKTALRSRALKNYMNRWREKEPEAKQVDLPKLVRGVNKVQNTLNNKFFVGLLPKMQKYANNKFLRSLLMKNSKFHLRALKPFFDRWRSAARKDLKSELALRLVAKTKNFKNNALFKDVLGKKFNQWRDNTKGLRQKMLRSIPPATKAIVDKNRKDTMPKLIKNLKANSLMKRQISQLTDNMKIPQRLILFNLKKAFDHWRTNAHKLALRQLRMKTMENYLQLYTKRMNKEALLRRFIQWRGHGKLNTVPIVVGTDTLKRLFIRKPYQQFKDKVKMMNLKIPSNMPLSSVLIRFNKNVAKSAALRNIGLRPYWKKYLRGVNKIKQDELKKEIFNKLFYPNWRNCKKTLLRKSFDKWRDLINSENLLNLKKNFHSKITLGIYEKNSNILLRRKFNHWRDVNTNYMKYLNNVSLGVVKLKHHFMRPFFNKVTNNNHLSNRFNNLKNIMINRLRSTDKGNLQFCFNRWKNNTNRLRELALKHKILKLVIAGQDGKGQENDKNNLHEKLLRWRINAAPRDWLQTILKVRKGKDITTNLLRAKTARPVFDNIAKRARVNKIKDTMYKFISKFDPAADKYLLQNRLKLWRSKVPDTERMKDKLRSVANKNILANHDTLVKKPVDMNNECMRAHAAMKNEKAKTITDYVRNIKNIYNRMQLVKRNLKLHDMFKNLNLKYATKARILFARWMKNANIIKSNEKAIVIQKFLRGKQSDLQAKRARVAKGSENLKKYIRLHCFNDIDDYGKKWRRFQLMSRLFKNYSDIGLTHFKRYFIRWRDNAKKMKEIEATDKINALARGNSSRTKTRALLKRQARVNDMVIKLFGKHLDKKRLYFNKWLGDTRLEKCDNSSRVIQNFVGNGMNNIKNVNAQLKVLKFARGNYIKNLHDTMKKASKVNGDRGLIMYDTLKNIYIQRPFDKIKDASKWIGRMKQLRSVTPKIQHALRLHWLPFYMRKWKSKTWDDKVKKVLQLQNWYRTRLMIWRKKAELRKAQLSNKFIAKMTRDNDLKKRLALKHWSKKAKFDTLNNQAKNVQKIWRGNSSRKNLDKAANKLKCRNLFRGLYLRNISDAMVKASDYVQPIKRNIQKLRSGFDNRYATNNLIDLSNNSLRNKYLYLLTNKRCFNDNLRSLRVYFNRFRNFANKANSAAQGIQTRYRQFRAINEKNRLLKVKDALLRLQGKYENTDKGILQTALRRWNNKAKILKLNEKAKVIQNFLKNRNDRWQNTKLKNFFADRAPKIVKKRLNNAAKVDNLNSTLRDQMMKAFFDRLRNKDKFDRLKWILVKKFHNLDGQMGKLFLQKYFRDWRNRANDLKNKMNMAALMVQRTFKGSNARKFFKNMQTRKARMLQMMLGLIDDYDIKKKVCFNVWLNKTKADKIDNSARVIQKFLGDVKDKSLKLKSNARLNSKQKGLNQLDDLLNKRNKNYAIEKIKSEANRKLMDSVVTNLDNKRTDHLKTGMNKIRDYADAKQNKKNEMATRIQRAWGNTKWRRHIWDLVKRIQRLRFIVKLMGDKNLQIKNSYFKKWKKNAMIEKWNSSAKTIQNFLNDRVLRWRNDQKIDSMQKMRNMFRNYFVNKKFRPYLKEFNDTVKCDRFKDHMGRHIFNKFKYNIFNWEKLNVMRKLFKLPDGIRQKILRKWLNIWRNKADALKRNEAATKLQKNFRSYKVNKRNNGISLRMEKILLKLACKNENIKKYYMLLWKRTAEKMKLKESADTICDFVDNNYKRIQAKKKYQKLSNGLIIKNGLYGLLDIMTRYRQFKTLTPVYESMDHKIKRDGFDELRSRSRLNRVGKVMRLIFGNFADRKANLSLYHWFKKWRQQVGKMNQRDKGLENIMDVIDTRRKIIGADAVANVSLVKKLLDLLPIIRAKDALKNIKWRAGNVQKLQDWSKKLVDADEDLQKKNSGAIAGKVYKLYVYKILDKMNSGLNRFKQNVLKPHYGKELLDKLNNNFFAGSNYNDNKKLKSTGGAVPKNLTFKSKVANPRREAESMRDKEPVKRLTPHLFNFLKKKINTRLGDALYKIKDRATANFLCKTTKKHVDEQILPTKNDFLDRLAKSANYHRQTPELRDRLKNMLRKYWVHKVCDGLIPVSKMKRLMYMIRLSFLHKMTAKNRKLRESMRKWRFSAFFMKVTREKMSLLYKNFHLNYLNAAQELFGDKDGMGKEFEEFGSKIGMFTNEDAIAHDNEMKNLCKTVKRRYEFDVESKIKFDDSVSLTDDNEYYVENDIGDGTYGRYKADTNKSIRTIQYYDEEDSKAGKDKKKTNGKR